MQTYINDEKVRNGWTPQRTTLSQRTPDPITALFQKVTFSKSNLFKIQFLHTWMSNGAVWGLGENPLK